MPVLTITLAIPTGKRHKRRTAHLGEPREEELQEKYTDVAVSSGTCLSNTGWKWFKPVALSTWAS